MSSDSLATNGTSATPAVLVVEDEAIIRMLLVDELEDAGLVVVEADGADGAMAILRDSAAIGVVVTDVRMPGSTDGLGLAAWMREHAPGVPIVITSGFSAPPDCQVINPAIIRVVSKPYLPRDVVNLLAALLAPMAELSGPAQ